VYFTKSALDQDVDGIKEFLKVFNVKNAIWSAPKSWDNAPKDILINA